MCIYIVVILLHRVDAICKIKYTFLIIDTATSIHISQLADDVPTHQALRCQADASIGHSQPPVKMSAWTTEEQKVGPTLQRSSLCLIIDT